MRFRISLFSVRFNSCKLNTLFKDGVSTASLAARSPGPNTFLGMAYELSQAHHFAAVH